MINDTRGLWRGKCVDNNNEWVEGDLSRINSVDNYFIEGIRSKWPWRVDPSTLGECTGLLDKNGKLIFEGDIVKIDKATIRGFEGKYGIVEWLSGDAAFALVFRHQWLFFNEHISLDDCEVIGNIHDNPELLKGAENNGSCS